MEDPTVGREIDGYCITEVLGRGGMGVVYKAKEVALARHVALKRIDPAFARDKSFQRRFRSEARALARIHSPHIVQIHGLRETAIGHIIIMEYVDGGTLKDKLKDGPMHYEELLPIMQQTLLALERAHAAGVIHRDVKPHNVMLTGEGHVKITDFGLAKINQSGDPNRTVTQGVFGTLQYMSPEQVRGYGRVDHRSDLYSLGMTMYQMLAGRLPFDDGSSQFTLMNVIVQEELPRLDHHMPGLPAELVDIVTKALVKDPADRYQSAAGMRAALKAFGDRQQQAYQPIRLKKADRNSALSARTWGWAGGMVLLVMVGVAAVFTYGPGLLSGQSSDGVSTTGSAHGTTAEPLIPAPIEPLIDIRDRGTLLDQLDRLQEQGQLSASGSSRDFVVPEDSLYVFVIGAQQQVEAVLGPDRNSRTNLRTGDAVSKWDLMYAGLEKRWVAPRP